MEVGRSHCFPAFVNELVNRIILITDRIKLCGSLLSAFKPILFLNHDYEFVE